MSMGVSASHWCVELDKLDDVFKAHDFLAPLY